MEAYNKKGTDEVLPDLVYLLGGPELVDTKINSVFDLITLSNEGIKKASLIVLINHMGISQKAFTESILNISIKTLERKRSYDRLDRQTSSHIIEIAKVLEHAYDVFETEGNVQKWLKTPNQSLNNMKPLDLFYLPTGLSIVNSVLTRIEHGVYS